MVLLYSWPEVERLMLFLGEGLGYVTCTAAAGEYCSALAARDGLVVALFPYNSLGGWQPSSVMTGDEERRQRKCALAVAQ
jgi:hypothetical protein